MARGRKIEVKSWTWWMASSREFGVTNMVTLLQHGILSATMTLHDPWAQSVAVLFQKLSVGRRYCSVCVFLFRGFLAMKGRRVTKDAPSYARFNVFTRGVIWGMYLAEACREQIQDVVKKKDGTTPSIRALDAVISHMHSTAWSACKVNPSATQEPC